MANRVEPHPIVVRILEILDMRGLTKVSLAKELGSSPSLITKWMNIGYMPALEHLEKICKFLDVSVEYIVLGKGSKDKASEIGNKDLSKEENELIFNFRTLAIPQKGEILGTAKVMAKKVSDNSSKKPAAKVAKTKKL